jgi:hypothetical protein
MFSFLFNYISLILSVHFPYSAGTLTCSACKFPLICCYIHFLCLPVHFPYSVGTFSLFCWYIYLILQVHLVYSPGKFLYFVGTFPYTADMFSDCWYVLPYSASTFLLFCEYISLILPVHFPYFVGLFILLCWYISLFCRNIFFFVSAFPLCHNCN